MNEKNLGTMEKIMAEKAKEIAAGSILPLDGEGAAIAGVKRKSFDLPTNAVNVDPLR